MSENFIAVLDIGKTNKKISIFNTQFQVIESVSISLDEIVEEGLAFEPVSQICEWFFAQIQQLAKQYPIAAVSVTTHGATFVCIDAAGDITVPVLSYSSDPGEEFHQRFHKQFGSVDELHKSTGTPSMPGLGCMGKSLFFIQENYPEELARTAHILNFPQYFGFLLTGKRGLEKTYIGNHTYMWDHKGSRFSPLLDQLNVRHLLPDTLNESWDILGTVNLTAAGRTGLSEKTVVTVGIHDSNAALLPYLVKEKSSFVLNSSGSVMVNMRCDSGSTLEDRDMGKTILFNTNAFSEPVRTSLYLGGLEYDIYQQQFQARKPGLPTPDFKIDIADETLSNKDCFIIPSLIPFGVFPSSKPRLIEKNRVYDFNSLFEGQAPAFVDDFEKAHFVLNLSLAIQTRVAIQDVGIQKGDTIYVEGGFTKNETYLSLLSTLFEDSVIMVSNLQEATSFGAAMLAFCALNKKQPTEISSEFNLECFEVAKISQLKPEGYMEAFLSYTRE